MVNQGYEGYNIPDDFSIPTCTIEDVDRALFNLFNEEMPFYFELEKESRRIPVIFATGERFAILRRRRPLRDRSGALILPLISMMRTAISQDVARGTGPGQTAPLIIKQRLDKEDPIYQRLVNTPGFRNQDNMASTAHFSDSPTDRRAKSGQVASRRLQAPLSLEVREGKLLTKKLDSKHIYEYITIPPIKYYMATYEVTFWSQYTQQMNHMLTAMMSAYQNMHRRTFRIETEKGYWFVAYIGESLGSESNFGDFADNERIIKYTLNIEVPAYIVNPSFPGAPNALRSFTSATDISFDIFQINGPLVGVNREGMPSGNPGKYVLDDLDNVGDGYPGAAILGPDGRAAVDPRSMSGNNSLTPQETVSIAGAYGGQLLYQVPELGVNPFTGKKMSVPLKAHMTTLKGETVYKDLSTGEVNPGVDGLIQIDI
tara:strand:- start:928 stop:2214 length:1287 start_codon:yes stop_codon:yes gene_type:complete